MGSGLSMTSVNKIKQLAEEKEYSLALDIIDSIDLTRSLNPQFLRTCGEVYMRCGKVKEARYALLLAHKIAPEAKRVMFSLVSLYLEAGYKTLADIYYQIYMYDADNSDVETKKMRYIYDKSKGLDYSIIDDYLIGDFEHNLDLDWSFEVILLLYLNGETERAKALSIEYIAAFEDNNNSEIVERMLNGEIEPRDYFYIYPILEVEDNDPRQEEERELEKKLLEADIERITPKEAEILDVQDDLGQFDVKNRFFKKKDKKSSDQNVNDETVVAEGKDSGDGTTSIDSEVGDGSDSPENEDNKKNTLLKKMFSKIKKDKSSGDSEDELSDLLDDGEKTISNEEAKVLEYYKSLNAKQEEAPKDFSVDDIEEMIGSLKEGKGALHASVDIGDDFDAAFEGENDAKDDENNLTGKSVEVEKNASQDVKETSSSIEDVYYEPEDVFDSEEFEDMSDESEDYNINIDINDLKENEYTEEPALDFIDDLESTEQEKTYDSLFDEELSYKEKSYESEEPEYEEKSYESYEPEYEETSYESEEPQYEEASYDEESEYEETSYKSEESEYEESSYDEESEYEETSYKSEESQYEETSYESEEPQYEEASYDEESEYEETSYESEESEYEEASYDNEESEYEETSYKSEESQYEEASYDEESVYEETSYESEEPQYEEASYDEESEYEETSYESEEPQYEETLYESEEPEYEESYDAERHMYDEEDSLIGESYSDEKQDETSNVNRDPWDKVTRRKLDFPVFKSSLFPDLEDDLPKSNNNFNQIMNEAQEKLDESNLKEAQMLKEAEELLASLGISLDTGSSSVTTAGTSIGNMKETIRPSRDELKASLEIDSIKLDTLSKLRQFD